jgi:hypothetical protein
VKYQRWLVELTVSICLIGYCTALPHAYEQGDHSKRDQAQPNPSPAPPLGSAGQNDAGPQRSAAANEPPKPGIDWRSIQWSNWILAGVGIAGIIVALKTLWAIEEQVEANRIEADASKTSAEALKVIHRQWVNVHGWDCTIAPLGDTKAWRITSILEITNETPLPLTIITVRCQFNKSKGAYEWGDRFLEPRHTHKATVSSFLSADEVADYSAGKRLVFLISGWVHFYDAFGDIQNQAIGCFCAMQRNRNPIFRRLAGLKKNTDKLLKQWPLDLSLGELSLPDDSENESGQC